MQATEGSTSFKRQEGTRVKHKPWPLLGVFVEKAKWDWENSLGLAGLNNSGGL